MQRTPSFPRWLLGAVAVAALAFAVACSSNPASDRAEDSDTANAPQVSGGPISGGEDGLAGGPVGDAFRDGAVESGAPAGGGGSSQGYEPQTLPTMLDRQIIRTALLSVTVEAVSQKFEEVSNIALGAGGFVASSSFGNSGESQTASVTIRVPGDQYDATLRRLRGLGEVKEESSTANDVTEQYTDLQSRLRNLQASEARYLDFLTRAENITDVLAVQDRINATRAEIEQVQGRIQLLDNQSSLATITVHLLPPVASAQPKDDGANTPLETAQDAFEASLAVLLGIATVAVAVAAFSWWLVPVAGAGFYVWRRQSRAGRDARQQA